jgi:hypothetical protein
MIDRMLKQARRAQTAKAYADIALTPPTEDETETLEMFTHNDAARSEVVRLRKVEALTHSARAPGAQQRARA